MDQAKIYPHVELEDRIRFETLISDISARFVKLPSNQVDTEIERALKQILEFFDVDRCGILGVSEDKQFLLERPRFGDEFEYLALIACEDSLRKVYLHQRLGKIPLGNR